MVASEFLGDDSRRRRRAACGRAPDVAFVRILARAHPTSGWLRSADSFPSTIDSRRMGMSAPPHRTRSV